MENYSNKQHGNGHTTSEIDFEAQDKGALGRIFKYIFVISWGHILFLVIVTAILALIISSICVSWFDGLEEPLFTSLASLGFTTVGMFILAYVTVTLFSWSSSEEDKRIGYIKRSTYNKSFIIIGTLFIFLSLIAIAIFILVSINVSFETGGEARIFVVLSLSIISFFVSIVISTFASMDVSSGGSFSCRCCNSCNRMYTCKKIDTKPTGNTVTRTTQLTHWVRGNHQEIGTLKDKSTGKEYTISSGHKGYFDTTEIKRKELEFRYTYQCLACGHIFHSHS